MFQPDWHNHTVATTSHSATHAAWHRSRVVFTALILALAAWCANTALAFDIQRGDLIVVDSDNIGSPWMPVVVDINPSTGQQHVISSGDQLVQPTAIAQDSAGELFVADYGYADEGKIIRINPATGQQTVVSSGGLLSRPTGIAIDGTGQLVVTQQGDSPLNAAILRIDPASGAQFTIAAGTPLYVPTGLAIDASGNLLVANFQNPTIGSSILGINATSGAQSVVSAGGYLDLGPEGIWLNNLKAHSALVTEWGGSPGNAILDINTLTGAQTVISAGGLLAALPIGLTQDLHGSIYVTVRNAGGGSVVKIDPVTGAQSPVSAGGNLITPSGILVATPEPSSIALLMAGAGTMALLYGRRRRTQGRAVSARLG